MRSATIVLGALLCACSSQPAPAATEPPFTATPVATFDEPWAMTFLPDGRLLVTEKAGRLLIVTRDGKRSEEHTSELQSLMRTSYAVFCLKKKKTTNPNLNKKYKTTKNKRIHKQ